MSFDTLLVESDGPVLTVTLNRPPMNPINRQMQADIRAMLEGEGADESIRAIILTGAGDRAFCAGADITEFPEINAEGAREALITNVHRLMRRVMLHPKPIIAAVNGYALGGGCELAMACHFRVVAETAQVGLPEIRLGIVPAYGGTQMLPRLVGKARALEMMLLARRITAAEALDYGWATSTAPAATLMEEARALATRLAKQAPLAVNGILKSVMLGMETTLEAGFEIEREMAAITHNTADAVEGATAFFQKREPKFQGK